MITWATHLYVGEKMKKSKDQVITSMNQRKAVFGVYCITYASNPGNLFDIIEANQLLFPHYARTGVTIVGLAKGKQEALELLEKMLLEVYNQTGEFDVRAYFT